MVPEFWRELPEIVRDIDVNAKARVIVISSTGKHFSAGMDLSVFTAGQSNGAAAAASKDERGRVARQSAPGRSRHSGDVQLSRTRAHARADRDSGRLRRRRGRYGERLRLPLHATQDAFFVVQEINIGMTADVGTFPRLCNLMPQGLVRELAYSGRRLPAKKAKEIGLVNEVFATQAEMLDACDGTGERDRGEIAARGARLEGDDQLRARSFHRRRPRLHRDLAGGHVQPRSRHARKLRRES